MARQNYDSVKADFKTARDWHVYHVYNDPEFIDDIAMLDKGKLSTQDITDKYSINGYDIFFYTAKQIIYLENNVAKKGQLTFDKDSRQGRLAFDLDITKAEFLELWDEFATLRDFLVGKPQKKRKAPEYHRLIYAIFKANKHHTFKEIYDLALNQNLPDYDGTIPDYWDEDKLQDYYDKYKPSNS